MKWLARLGYVPKADVTKAVQAAAKRGYNAAVVDRLNADWKVNNLTSDQTLSQDLERIRARCRSLEENDGWAIGILNKIVSNVVGPQGIRLQSVAMMDDYVTPDILARELIEKAWKAWGERGVCTVCGRFSWEDLQGMVLRRTAVDGEILARKVKGADNPFGFALQILEADHLDVNYNRDLADGVRVRLGIEYNSLGRPLAYYIRQNHPGDFAYSSTAYALNTRVPAEDIIHLAHFVRPTQGRGVPWLAHAVTQLRHLNRFLDAVVVGQRLAASTGGFIETPTGDEVDAADAVAGDDANGLPDDQNLEMEVAAGMIRQLPAGSKFQPFAPPQTNTGLWDYIKSVLRSVTAGMWGPSYNSAAKDLEGVNYSSLRQGALDERDDYRMLQAMMIGKFCTPVFKAWLEMALLSGAINLPFRKMEKFRAVRWQRRGWSWVDPQKDINAALTSIRAGLSSFTEVAAEQGKDLEEVARQLTQDYETLRQAGIIPDLGGKMPPQEVQVVEPDGT